VTGVAQGEGDFAAALVTVGPAATQSPPRPASPGTAPRRSHKPVQPGVMGSVGQAESLGRVVVAEAGGHLGQVDGGLDRLELAVGNLRSRVGSVQWSSNRRVVGVVLQ
jgi:hypothetical protein